ncbi:arsenate reductase/protein-tyrosine-phosphatase family protein [Micromonospora craniellae]|uniref:protein-tyrosine-phosphatase n=1 Tax=Micromonospora craniellae TaxID=2294034 RepID=A0A372G5P4_9ACTN|nr:phosphotyrosine protein phosphatase [Micromonospora craniellae]QOC90567.1 phosphotyrosine protein phosphatase [Micromonospora craniellae]RFS48050.1 phosphotyrosine protein phosphatase [Micromonospora craniellae]
MPPFTVLHVCMGNICRSPMAERLLSLAVAQRLARRDLDPGRAEELLHSHSAGTGGWHAGEEMNPPAARQVTTRGGTVAGFAARKLRSDHIDAADLVLTATADQQEYVVALRPDAAARTFVLGEFGRLLTALDRDALPSAEATPDAVYARGVAVVEAANVARPGMSLLPSDDLDDPWGRGDQCFSRVADEIEETIHPLAASLLP